MKPSGSGPESAGSTLCRPQRVETARQSGLPVPGRRVLFGLVAFLYLTAFPYHPKLRSPNELCRLWQARALVEYGTLELNQALADYGYVGDLSVKDGRYYPSKAPLLSFAAVPIYAVLRWLSGGFRYAVTELPLVYFSRLFLTVLPTLAMLVWLRRFLRAYVSDVVADALTVTYAVGSLAFSYSLLFMSHQTTAVLLFASFYALWRCARDEWRERGYLLAGAFAGAAIFAEYTGALGVAGLVLYGALTVLWRTSETTRGKVIRLLRTLGLATAGALPFVVGLMLYQRACFGHALQSGYQHLADLGYQPWHVGGFLGIRLPDLTAFVQSFFSPLRGFFSLAPFLTLALPGMMMQLQQTRLKPVDRALSWFAVALLAGYAYFTSSFSYESWGWTTGPRHLTGLVPFLVLPAAICVERLRQGRNTAARLRLGMATALCALSIAITGSVTLVNYIPDCASNAFFGIALKLFREGYLPPTVFAFVGLPNPWSGALELVVLGAAALLVALQLTLDDADSPGQRAGSPGDARQHAARLTATTGLATCLVYLGALLLATDAARDGAAVAHLESVWLVPRGKAIDFFGFRQPR